jgi:hypothetical protein
VCEEGISISNSTDILEGKMIRSYFQLVGMGKHVTRALSLLITFFVAPTFAQPAFETPHPLKAADVLSPSLRKGPFHRVDEKVLNDGYMNTYTVHSSFGTLKVVSTASLKLRIEELSAIDAMRQVEETDTFEESLAESAQNTVDGVFNIVDDPKAAFSGAVTGIGKVFQRASEAIQSSPGAGEDSRMENLIGYSKTKREYAHAFGVDVYSPNPILQQQLDKMAKAGYAGSISVTALKALIPGGVGLALSVTGSTQLLNDLIATTPPTELRSINRDRLTAMNIHPDLIDLFINQTVFTPRDQTLIVAALERVPKIEGRSEFIKFAISTDTEDLAAFRTRVAMMYAVYNQKQSPIDSFGFFSPVLLARAGDTLVFIVPVDHLLWTPHTDHILREINRIAAKLGGIQNKQLWLAGTLTDASRIGIKDMGWEVFTNCDESLGWHDLAEQGAPES